MAQTTIAPSGIAYTEIFSGPSSASIKAAMDNRLAELAREGHSFSGRRKIGRNAPCPCGSGRKLKKCHLDSATISS